jgi:hypothetical protein
MSDPKIPAATPIKWAFKGGYRMTVGDLKEGKDIAHGVQLVGGPTFQITDFFKLGLSLEVNEMFLFSKKDPKNLKQDAVLGGHFEGIEGRTYEGSTYSDVTGGTQYQSNANLLEMVPEVQLMFRPAKSFPFEVGLRAGFGMKYTSLHTETDVQKAAPQSHYSGDSNCVPGDIYCTESPIPEPAAGPSSEHFENDTSDWSFFARFGPRVVFPIHDSFQLSSELLFVTNSKTGTFDRLWRTAVSLSIPLSEHFRLIAEPRYNMKSVSDQPLLHGFDLFAGIKGTL